VNLAPHQSRWLVERFGRRVRFGVPMSRLTWFRIGGPAWALVTVHNLDELSGIAAWSTAEAVPCFLLGGGSNLLVGDEGVEAVVVRLCGDFKKVAIAPSAGKTVHVQAMAGAPLSGLCRKVIAESLAGLEFAVGIPGSVGGAIRMNAGSAGCCIADVLQALDLLLPGGKVLRLERQNLSFTYRQLALPDADRAAAAFPPVIVKGSFRMQRGERSALDARIEALLRRRRATQPLDLPSAGCFFKNPPGARSAGELIDLAGLKGTRAGAAEISTVHGNFIVNRGGATAREVLSLKERVEKCVLERFGIQLEPEVQIVGS
jgi:UDP-N-acetylmuramate dehydrogenase